MRSFLSIAALIALCAIAGVVAVGNAQDDGVRRITPEEARAAVEKGKAIIIDVRALESYNIGHVKGSRSIPVSEIEDRAGELPRDKMIITYCS